MWLNRRRGRGAFSFPRRPEPTSEPLVASNRCPSDEIICSSFPGISWAGDSIHDEGRARRHDAAWWHDAARRGAAVGPERVPTKRAVRCTCMVATTRRRLFIITKLRRHLVVGKLQEFFLPFLTIVQSANRVRAFDHSIKQYVLWNWFPAQALLI